MTSGTSPAPPTRFLAAYGLLALAALSWGGNAVAGRLAVGEISPMALTTLRWGVVCAGLTVLARREVAATLPAYRARWGWFLAMGGLGYTAWAGLYYVAAHLTSAVNLVLMQGIIPVLVALGAVATRGARLGGLQVLGMAATLLGVAVVATAGDLTAVARLDLNLGDVMILIASVLYAGYTLGLASRPKLPPLAFFTGLAFAALVTSVPLLAGEVALQGFRWPTPMGWAVMAYAAVFPSLVAQIAFLKGVEAIGPERAGLFVNLVPVFGAGLAVLVLGERFGPEDAVAMALVIGGILVAEVSARRLKPPAAPPAPATGTSPA